MVDLSATLGADLAGASAPFPSLLYAAEPGRLVGDQPYFDDLNLREVLAAITTDAHLWPIYCTPVDRASIRLRHSIFRDLDANEAAVRAVEAFGADMEHTRRLSALSARVRNRLEAMGWHLAACEQYVDALRRLLAGLIAAHPQSPPLTELTARLSVFVGEPEHAGLAGAVARIRGVLDGLRFNVAVARDNVSISHFHDEPDYNLRSRRILRRFLDDSGVDEFSARFAGPAVVPDDARQADLNIVESNILVCVGRLFPREFDDLAAFCAATDDFVDPRIAAMETELRFFTGYRAFVAGLTGGDTPVAFCYPEIADDPRAATWIIDAYDLALLLSHRRSTVASEPLVGNDFGLEPDEWAAIVSGPNQAGKTTFARMVGQVHHLAAIGVPVPARRARLRPVQTMYTHFERAQSAVSDRGRLADELVRLQDIVRAATGTSLVILNDSLASTSRKDAQALAHAILDRLGQTCAACVYVTAVGGGGAPRLGAVSMVSAVDAEDPARRTFRIERSSAPGTAYATALAASYRLTYDGVMNRLRR